MFVVQLLVPSGARWKSSMDVTVVVELASRIQDLVACYTPGRISKRGFPGIPAHGSNC